MESGNSGSSLLRISSVETRDRVSAGLVFFRIEIEQGGDLRLAEMALRSLPNEAESEEGDDAAVESHTAMEQS